MREKVRDRGRLEHILEAIESIEEFHAQYTFEDIKKNKLIFYGFTKLVEVIGEAVLSTGGRLHPRFLRFLSPRTGGTEGGVKTIEEGLGEKVEPSLAKEGRGDSKNFSFERRPVQSDTAMRNQI